MGNELSSDMQDNEKRKFKETPNGKRVAVVVCAEASDPVPVTSLPDTAGDTLQFAASVTAVISLPTVAGNAISLALVRCKNDQAQSKRLEVSFDGGSTFMELSPGEFVGWPLKGDQTQIQIKAATTTDYEIIINRVP